MLEVDFLIRFSFGFTDFYVFAEETCRIDRRHDQGSAPVLACLNPASYSRLKSVCVCTRAVVNSLNHKMAAGALLY